MYRNTVALYN